MTREFFEKALDAGRLQTASICGAVQIWHDCHRNGSTRTWKRDPSRFVIPIKYELPLPTAKKTTTIKYTMRVTDKFFQDGSIGIWFRTKK